jgi:S1-C subfamily serine protease
LISNDEITRTADRLRDAFAAAADAMTVGDSLAQGAAADVITIDGTSARIRGTKAGHARKWLIPLAAAASVLVIALVTVLADHPAKNASAGSPYTLVLPGIGPAQLGNVPAPDPAVLNSPGAQAAQTRVVKILGSAPECGRNVEGSGFVYASQHVITAAHVVAGVTQGPTVTTSNGITYRARVVFYDPRMDLAVLDVPGLNLTPLNFAGPAENSAGAVVAGYPLNHPLTAAAARIGGIQRAVGPDIYQTGQVARQVYEIKANVEPGSTGGPLLSPSGTVYGMVLAAAVRSPDAGFALTASGVQADANAGASATTTVSTQGCIQ